MLNLNSIMIGSMQPKVLADFYKKVFDRPADMEEGDWYGWKVGEVFLSIGEHSKMSGAWIATLADPDGNYFQLMPPWESKK